MSKFTDLFSTASSRPKLITTLTLGSGTYIPTEDMARCLVRIQAGGASGNSANAPNATGGGAGAMVEAVLRVPIAGVDWVVGAGGASVTSGTGDNGSKSRFGSITAQPGKAGNAPANTGGYIMSGNTGTGAFGSVPGMSGGCGGSGSGGGGGAPGHSFPSAASYNTGTSTGEYGSGGGDSAFGFGGNGATTNATDGSPGTGYGSGGGGAHSTKASGAGMPGVIEVWDYGA